MVIYRMQRRVARRGGDARSRRDVADDGGGQVAQLPVGVAAHEVDQARHQAGVDHELEQANHELADFQTLLSSTMRKQKTQ